MFSVAARSGVCACRPLQCYVGRAVAVSNAKLLVLCCHLVNINEKLGGLVTAIPLFAKLLWFLAQWLSS